MDDIGGRTPEVGRGSRARRRGGGEGYALDPVDRVLRSSDVDFVSVIGEGWRWWLEGRFDEDDEEEDLDLDEVERASALFRSQRARSAIITCSCDSFSDRCFLPEGSSAVDECPRFEFELVPSAGVDTAMVGVPAWPCDDHA
jgi:hypothetical protein